MCFCLDQQQIACSSSTLFFMLKFRHESEENSEACDNFSAITCSTFSPRVKTNHLKDCCTLHCLETIFHFFSFFCSFRSGCRSTRPLSISAGPCRMLMSSDTRNRGEKIELSCTFHSDVGRNTLEKSGKSFRF